MTEARPCPAGGQHGPHAWSDPPRHPALHCPAVSARAETAADLPAEPDEGSAVRDKDGFVWVRILGGWSTPGLLHPIEWDRLVEHGGPLHLLVDGPVLT